MLELLHQLAAMKKTSPDWSSLPQHLLAMIAQCLQTRIDFLRFRAVCNSFRSSVPSPASPFSDIRYYYNSKPISRPPKNLVIAESTIYSIEPISEISNTNQPPPTWLLNVEDSPSGKVRVLDPFSNFHFEHISGMLPKSLNLLDYRVKEISKVYRLVAEEQPILANSFCDKVVVSTDDDDFAIMALIGGVVMWRSVDNKWVDIDIDPRRFPFVSDIIYHNKKFYVFSFNGTLTVDAKSLKVELVAPKSMGSQMLLSNRLVKSGTDLFLIQKFYYDIASNRYSSFMMKYESSCCQVGLIIYKFDEERNEWIEVKDGFKDRALFMSRDCIFFLSAEEFSGFKWNCVYLADRPAYFRHDYPGSNAVIFDLGNRSTARLSAFPGYSEVFWPPPSWLFP